MTPDGAMVDSNQAIESDDFCWWELEKFLRLALKANPTALEVLYVGESELISLTDVGRNLRELRSAFLSKHLYHTYSGYVLSQFRRMKKAEENGKPYRPKHAMHLVRLLYSGIAALGGDGILVDVGDRREELLEIKRSPPPLEEVHDRALGLAAQFQKKFERTPLPDQPDVQAVDRFLIEARRSRAAEA